MGLDAASPLAVRPREHRIAIIGAGLAGLYAACLLEQRGILDYVILEARTRSGGRVVSTALPPSGGDAGASGSTSIDRFDLGATWVWPELQTQLYQLIQELGLSCFPQQEEGTMLVERARFGGPMRVPGYLSAPAPVRLVGGTMALIDRLQQRLHADRVRTGQAVRRIHSSADTITLEAEDAIGSVTSWRVREVLLALPPRLAEASIVFTPDLPQGLVRQWRSTETWMARHAKYLAIYDQPFWRAQGLSGEARSLVGPLAEIHDASMPGGYAALFGFLGASAEMRRQLGEPVLLAQCRAQLVRLFGAQAGAIRAEFFHDWASDPCTASAADLGPGAAHGVAPDATPAEGRWHGRLIGIASEWSPQFPGYLAGAVEAATLGVAALNP